MIIVPWNNWAKPHQSIAFDGLHPANRGLVASCFFQESGVTRSTGYSETGIIYGDHEGGSSAPAWNLGDYGPYIDYSSAVEKIIFSGNGLDVTHFTLIARIRIAAVHANMIMGYAGSEHGSDSRYVLQTWDDGLGYVSFYDGSQRQIDGGAHPTDWFTLSARYDQSTLSIEYDGVQQNSASFTGTPTGTGTLRLGGQPNNSFPFQGDLAWFRVYNRKLTDTELMRVVKAPFIGFHTRRFIYTGISVVSGPTEINASESIGVQLSEQLDGFIDGSISEAISLQLTEQVQGYVEGQLAETHSVNPDEAILLTNSLLASDSIAIGLQESTQFENSLEAEESVTVGLSESTQFFNTLSVLDGHAISITEQATLTPFGLLAIHADESVSINFSEQTIHFNTCSVEELLAILFSEDGSVEIDATGPVSINVTDTISLNPQESVQFYVDLLAAESIQLILLESSDVEETSGLPVQIVASESIGVNLTESVQFLNSLNVSESVSVALLESSSLVLYGLLAVSGSETIPVFVTEQTQFSNTLEAQESVQLAFLETLEGVIIGTVLISASEEIAILVNELASLNTGITLGKIIVSSVVDVNPSFTASSEHPVYTVASLQSLYGAIKTT